MSTPLKKPVTRRTTLITDNRGKPRACDEVNVTIYPNNTIGFRAKRSRTEYRMSLATAYTMAIAANAIKGKKGGRKAA